MVLFCCAAVPCNGVMPMKTWHGGNTLAIAIVFLGIGVLLACFLPEQFMAAIGAIAIVILGCICFKH